MSKHTIASSYGVAVAVCVPDGEPVSIEHLDIEAIRDLLLCAKVDHDDQQQGRGGCDGCPWCKLPRAWRDWAIGEPDQPLSREDRARQARGEAYVRHARRMAKRP